MKYLVRDTKGVAYNVTLDRNGYIESYQRTYDYSSEFGRQPDLVDAYFEIDESLPSRFEAWKLDAA